MFNSYDPYDWYWTVEERPGQAYSSLRKAFVSNTDPTYSLWQEDGRTPTSVKTTQDVVSALLRVGAVDRIPPSPIAVDLEKNRRLRLMFGASSDAHFAEIKNDAFRESIRLLRVKAERPWTISETVRETELQNADKLIVAMDTIAAALKQSVPDDYRDNKYWPAMTGLPSFAIRPEHIEQELLRRQMAVVALNTEAELQRENIARLNFRIDMQAKPESERTPAEMIRLKRDTEIDLTFSRLVSVSNILKDTLPSDYYEDKHWEPRE